ncbi:hypothetical protein COU75_00155 [Candidatus Peregrinibacteria bacterium CG10_big_fil_rev_8_21_14_0_10_42_8]|nr:MAG: hypothetical protein COU75_00155 [Candidatus Peregrinibacteria bacterium CG10_big_fil_rev_8_21_14_0_10_42_8]
MTHSLSPRAQLLGIANIAALFGLIFTAQTAQQTSLFLGQAIDTQGNISMGSDATAIGSDTNRLTKGNDGITTGSSYWYGRGDAWWGVSLTSGKSIRGGEIVWHNNPRYHSDFIVEASTDGTSWNELARFAKTGAQQTQTWELDNVSQSYRFYRYRFINNTNLSVIMEGRFFEAEANLNCGNGVIEGNEDCDDGNTVGGDGCTATCDAEVCGNGIVTPNEECDDTNYIDNDACPNNCKLPVCGSGIIEGNEECDDGNTVGGDGCNDMCKQEICGNNVLDKGEECDDGNTNPNDGCSTTCTKPKNISIGATAVGSSTYQNPKNGNDDNINNYWYERGDTAWGIRLASPMQVMGGEIVWYNSLGFHSNFTIEGSNDGEKWVKLGSFEKSDNNVQQWMLDAPSAAYRQFQYHFTGNTNLTVLQEARFFEAPSGGISQCGNGVIEAGEQCESSSDCQATAGTVARCSSVCLCEAADPVCGNGVMEADEECDDGNNDNSDGCSMNCKNEVCGDGIVQASEQCDDGNDNTDDSCRNDCTNPPVCGDGRVDTSVGEQCDDGNNNSDTTANACRTSCVVARCGDGVADTEEECDDGNGSNDDMCTTECRVAPIVKALDIFGIDNIQNPEPENKTQLGMQILDAFMTALRSPSSFDFNNNGSSSDEDDRGIIKRALFLLLGIEKYDGGNISSIGDYYSAASSLRSSENTRIDADYLNIGVRDGVYSYNSNTNTLNLGDVSYDTKGNNLTVDHIFIAIEGDAVDGSEFTANDRIHNMVENVQMRNKEDGTVVTATRLLSSQDSGVAQNSSNLYQIYRFDNLELKGDSTWELLANIANYNGNDQHPLDGDAFRMHICTEPSHILFPQGGYTITNTSGCDFGGMVYPTYVYQMVITGPSTGNKNITVDTRGTVSGNFNAIKQDSNATKGDLYITKGTSPLRTRQLLGGTLGEALLRLELHAENEPIDVTDIQFTSSGSTATSIDRLELYRDGEFTPFTLATKEGCGSDAKLDHNPSAGGSAGDGSVITFCAIMENEQLVVPDDADINVIVRPRMKTDVQGGVSNQIIALFLSSGTSDYDNLVVQARGAESSNDLTMSDEDGVAEGEIFVGAETATSNSNKNAYIVGGKNVSVLSKITSITNANPDANGTSVPTGISAIGQFTMEAAAHNNSKNGANDFILDGIIFNVNATNVDIDASSFAFYNKADQTQKIACTPYDQNKKRLSGKATGNIFVSCTGQADSVVNTEINEGTDETFVLQADIINPNNAAARGGISVLQASLTQFDNIKYSEFDNDKSHIFWYDKDGGGFNEFLWIEYPETTIRSTSYSS